MFSQMPKLAQGILGAELGVGLGMPMLYDSRSGVGRGVKDFLAPGRLDGLRQMAALSSTERGQRALYKANKRKTEFQSLQASMAQSLARLAAASPQTYNQVMAGRQLPQGAGGLGGAPRVDLMEDLALRMASNPQAIPGAPAQPSVMDLI